MDNFNSANFWKDPTHVSNELKKVNGGKFYRFCQPAFYLDMTWGTRIALYVLNKYAKKEWSILEIGCNTGKVMANVINAGFKNVSGIEINPAAISLGRKHYPVLNKVQIINSPIEEVVKDIDEVDVIYACGVYMHLPPEFEWVFEVIANKARKLILTTENEAETDFFKWGRNYKDIFEKLGWVQLEEQSGALYPPLPASSVVRVFMRPNE